MTSAATACDVKMESATAASDVKPTSTTSTVSGPNNGAVSEATFRTDSTQDPQNQVYSQMLASSDDSHENLEEYETQLFGFTPKSFINGIYNSVGEYFMEACNLLEELYMERFSELMSRGEIVEKMNVVRRHLVTQIDKAFDRLETYLATNIFCIPPNVVLPEDQIQVDQPVSHEEEQKVLQEIEFTKKKILAVKLANAILKKRLQCMMDLQNTLDAILKHLNEADSTVRREGVVDLRDSLKHCSDRILSTIHILKGLKADGPHTVK